MKNHAKHAKTILRATALPFALLAALASGPVWAVDWTNASGNFDYSDSNNWQSLFLPWNGLDEVALINNGDPVFLNTPLANVGDAKPAGLAVSNGSLEIQSGGSLAVSQGSSEPGDVTTGLGGTLTVRRGGTLTFFGQLANNGSLVLGEAGGSGTAILTPDAFTPNGTATMNGTTRVIGPNVDFQASSFSLGGGHTLIAEITNSTSHSALSTDGNANLGGSLALEFNGVSPSTGDSWTLIDAASISGSFANISRLEGAPLGQAVFLDTSAGGNGQLLSATIVNQLVLSINVATGATSIDNLSASTTETIDGYGIFAATSTLDPVGWASFQETGQTGWEEANAAVNHLGELNLDGSRDIAAGSSISLGTAYTPPSEFGVAPESVSFEYNLASGATRQGAVNLVGANTLVLRIDPTTGQAQILNPSRFDVEIDGYGITSESGSLNPVAWTPLSDSDAAWEEANAAINHVGELNLESSQLIQKLESGAPIALGALFDFDAPGTAQDLTFQFNLVGGAAPGDFTGDGNVTGADFLAWQRGESPGAGSAEDLAAWQANFGATGAGGGPGGTYTGVVEYMTLSVGGGGSSAPVPEPASCLLTGLGFLGLSLLRRVVIGYGEDDRRYGPVS